MVISVGKLDDEGLYRCAARLDLDAEIEVQLERVRGDGHLADPDDVDGNGQGRLRRFIGVHLLLTLQPPIRPFAQKLGLLLFVAGHHAGGPGQPPIHRAERVEPAGLLPNLRVRVDLLPHLAVFAQQPLEIPPSALRLILPHKPPGQLDLFDTVGEHGIPIDVRFHPGKHGRNGVADPHGDLFPAPHASLSSAHFRKHQRLHPLLGFAGNQYQRRLVARSGDLGQDIQRLAQTAAQLVAGLVPEVGGDRRAAFVHLRRTSDIDHHAGQSAACVEGVEEPDRMVFVPFDMAEVRPVRAAVHLGSPPLVRRQPVVPYDGMTEPEAHAARLAALPRLGNGPGNPGRGEFQEPRRRHDVVARHHAEPRPLVGNLQPIGGKPRRDVQAGPHARRLVGVRGQEHDLLHVDFGL